MSEQPGGASGGTAFQLLTLVEGLLFVGLVVTFSVGATSVGVACAVGFAVLLVPTILTYRRIQASKDESA
jgi:isoprenylcysteine carboxyl methyltransferase (ICMT) family protein YpbQ